MYGFYLDAYAGAALTEEEFNELLPRARDVLADYRRRFRVRGGEEAEKKALCAMAEAVYSHQGRRAGVTSATVGGVSVRYSQDTGEKALKRALYQRASIFLDIYRGVGQ